MRIHCGKYTFLALFVANQIAYMFSVIRKLILNKQFLLEKLSKRSLFLEEKKRLL